jgi:hypothetical protein
MADNLYFSRDTKIFVGVSKIKRIQLTETLVSGESGIGGSGYTSAPAIVITGGGGSGAAASANLNANGTLVNPQMTNEGKDYTSTPIVTIGNIYANSTALALADQVNAGGILYTVTSAGTTASSGNGPTHTSGSADDGTVTFAHAGEAATARTGAGVWEIPVLDGFSFSQSTNTTEVTLNEAVSSSGTSRRGRQMFTDSYAPSEWSFSTYARPFKSSGGGSAVGDADRSAVKTHAVEELLWCAMAGVPKYLSPISDASASVNTTTAYGNALTFLTTAGSGLGYTDGSRMVIDFDDSNTPSLGELDIYFSLGEEAVESRTLLYPTINGDSIVPKPSTQAELINGNTYSITSTGDVNWTSIGASATDVGTVFTYNNATVTGTGSAKELNLVAGTEYIIAKVGISSGTSGAINWNDIAVESLVNADVAPGDKFTAKSGKQITMTSLAVVTQAAGKSNSRLWIPLEGIKVGDKVSFPGTSLGTTTVSSLAPTPLNFVSSDGIVMADARIVPAGTIVRFGRRLTYKIPDCCVNEASIDFDIDGIATINWSGLGQMLAEDTPVEPTVFEDITSTNNFIRNRLSTLQLVADDKTSFPGHSGSDGVYNITLTGGNITISNNMSFLTPESLGVVNQPLQHVSGTRSVSGNFTCYLTRDDASTPTTGTSASLFEKIIENKDIITNKFAMRVNLGGDYDANDPKPIVSLNIPQTHLELPTHSLDDVVSLEVNFHGLPSTVEETDELLITYIGV